MDSTDRNSAFATTLIAADLVLATFVLPELHFALNLVALFLMAGRFGSFIPLAARLAWPSLAVVAVSIIATLANPAPVYDVMKGLFYLLKPAVYLAVGVVALAAVRDMRAIGRAVVIAAGVLAAIYVARYYLDPTIPHYSRVALRRVLGVGSVLWPFALALLLFRRRAIFPQARLPVVVTAALIVLAVAVSSSRTAILAGGLLILTMASILPRATLPRFWAPALLILLLLLTTPLIYLLGFHVDYQWVGGVPMMADAAPIQQATLSGMNEHWRGHETFLAFNNVFNADAAVFGRGLGAEVPIGFTFETGGHARDALAVFHNGFALILVRAGLVGLALYIVQMMVLAGRFARSGTTWKQDPWCAFGSGTIYVAIFTTFSIAGLYNGQEAGVVLPLLLGALSLHAASLPHRQASPATITMSPAARVRRPEYAGQ